MNIHQVRSRGTRFAMELDLHLEVDPSMTVDQAHSVAHALEDELRREMPYLADVVVHVEPGRGPPARAVPQAERADFRENTGQRHQHEPATQDLNAGEDRGKRPKYESTTQQSEATRPEPSVADRQSDRSEATQQTRTYQNQLTIRLEAKNEGTAVEPGPGPKTLTPRAS